jgi:hypothetical protein
MTYKLNVNTHFSFHFTRPDNEDELPHWPESLPYPEWKPNTDKLMRPDVVTFGWDFDPMDKNYPLDAYDLWRVYIHGPRLNKSGPGAEVKSIYHYDIDLPAFAQQLVLQSLERVNMLIVRHQLLVVHDEQTS